MATLTVSGNELTDLRRRVALGWPLTQQGGSTDGAAVPGGVGVWEAGTNLFRRGQCDQVTDWAGTAGSVVSLDATTPAPFSPQSIKFVTDGTASDQGLGAAWSATGQAAAAATVGVGSIYFKGVAGQSYDVHLSWLNTDATQTSGTNTTFTASGAWQLVTPPSVAVAAGKTGDQLRLRLTTHTNRAESLWYAHTMLQEGVNVVSPYVATSGGATATRAAGGVQAPASLLNATQGWIAMRVRMAWASAAGPAVTPVAFSWDDGTANNRVQVLWASPTWATRRVSGGVNGAVASIAGAFAAGDSVTIVLAWDATKIYLSINGSPFTSANVAVIPAGLLSTFKLGYAFATGNNMFDSSFLWAACGTGAFTNADAARIAALWDATSQPNRILMPWDFPPAGIPTMVWDPRGDGTAATVGAAIPSTTPSGVF